jgi:hypothetical protein
MGGRICATVDLTLRGSLESAESRCTGELKIDFHTSSNFCITTFWLAGLAGAASSAALAPLAITGRGLGALEEVALGFGARFFMRGLPTAC